MRRILNGISLCVLSVFWAPIESCEGAEAFLVKDGQAQCEIVIAENAPRSTRLAAQELQTYLRKISGGQARVVNTPTGRAPVSVYVGRSPYTDRLIVTDEGLENGAYRMVSGDNWLVLIGRDKDFQPTEPWPRNNNDIASGKMQRAWNKITGKHWGYTHSQLHKHYSGSNSLFGTAQEQKVDKDGNVNVWTYDERGSFNAVCGFLRGLGVRWYMPGEIGEVLPQLRSLPLPQVDETVRPDFPMRILNFRASVYGRDAMMWGFRLGVRQPFGRQAAHGLARMTHNEHTKTHHPDWFALYGGRRHTQSGRLNQLCYSNEELFREAVEFARAQFDHYDMDVVSIMPPDGYTAICQCKLCEGKASPELGSRGLLSNYVWEFVNRVAKEIGKSHPGKKISNCAYGVYTTPPNTIAKLEPNVQVIIVGGRRPTSPDRMELRALREAWSRKTDNPIEIFENYPFTGRGFYLPAYIPRELGQSINATKGVSRGEDIWITMDFGENAIGYNHFLLYFTARMYWGGTDQDAVALFDEYCRLFYGPASAEMQDFFRYCEKHWREMEQDGAKAKHALRLFALAKSKADEGSIYGRRIQLIDNFLNGLRNKSVQLAQKRGPVPVLRLVGGSRGQVVIDGKFDEATWKDCPVASTGRLRELQTGRQPIFGTSFKTAWIGNDLFFAIRCEEEPGKSLNVAAKSNGDQAIWYGDLIEILLSTESHSHYQIVVNPAAATIDLDRGAKRSKWFDWASQAEVATKIESDHWNVEIRIPITSDENDPLHQVVGRKPTQSLPWHVNICRQRIRETGSEYSAFSPTGSAGFHEPMKFAHFFRGNSHRFPADESVSDFLIESRKATRLLQRRKYKAALEAFLTISRFAKNTKLQQSTALAQAAICARRLEDLKQADELVNQIPIDSVQKTARMEHLLDQRSHRRVIEEFGEEDLRAWPFWQIGAGAFARARAYAFEKEGAKAEADFQAALQYTADSRTRTSIYTLQGQNREANLQDDARALQAYRRAFEDKIRIGGADEFRALQNAAKILVRQGRIDEALKTLHRAKIDSLKGYWRHSMLLSLGQTLVKAKKTEAAQSAFQKVIQDASASKQQRQVANAALQQLQPN